MNTGPSSGGRETKAFLLLYSAEEGFFCLIGNFVPYQTKTLRGMRTRAKWIFVAKATALGARVPQAELFALSAGSGPAEI